MENYCIQNDNDDDALVYAKYVHYSIQITIIFPQHITACCLNSQI